MSVNQCPFHGTLYGSDENCRFCNPTNAQTEAAAREVPINDDEQHPFTAVQPAREQGGRTMGKKYLEWGFAGGPNECKHGYAAGIACPRCDEEAAAREHGGLNKPCLDCGHPFALHGRYGCSGGLPDHDEMRCGCKRFMTQARKEAENAAAPPVVPLKHYHERPIGSYDAAIEQIEKTKQPVVAQLKHHCQPEGPDAGDQGKPQTTLSGRSEQAWLNHIATLFTIASPGEDIPWQALLAWTGTPTEEDFMWARQQLAEVASPQAAVPESQDGLPPLVPTPEELAKGREIAEQYKGIKGANANPFHIADLLCRERQLSALGMKYLEQSKQLTAATKRIAELQVRKMGIASMDEDDMPNPDLTKEA